jgi:hypothetical protein
MTDLVLQDLENLTGERQVQVLSKEKREMLGVEDVPGEKRAVDCFCLSFLARSLRKAKQIRPLRWSRHRFEVRNNRNGGKQW